MIALAVLGVGALSFGLRPPGALSLSPVARQPMLWRGAYHVHSTLSDGSGSPEEIAAAAAAAGLDFVILTDHGNATRPPAPPRMMDGVLVIDAVEISTDDGHYVALDLPQAPYPLAGEGRAVVEDVRRLGGLGILAHPDSPRDSLAWHDASADADGFEWVNADTTWRTASTMQVLSRLFTYPFNRPGTLAVLARYPAALFAERDVPSRRPQLALAAVDAHARIGWQRAADPLDGGRTVAEFPSYRSMFGTFGLVVPWLDGTPSGEATRDARAVLHAIRHRRAYSAVFSMASPMWLSLELVEPAATATPGPDARDEATLAVLSNAPAGATVHILRNGVPYRETSSAEWSMPLPAGESGAMYRAEVWLPARRGWPALPVAVSAARGHNLALEPATGTHEPGTGSRPPATGMVGAAPRAARGRPADGHDTDVEVRGWHVEHDPASSGAMLPSAPVARAAATLGLAPGTRVSQFSALVADLAPPPADATALHLELSASGPMRVSVQVREPRPGEGLRWRHSAYLDGTPRAVLLPLEDFRPIRPASGRPPLERLHALLFVMDTVNARPGDSSSLTVHAIRWYRDR